MHRDQYSVVKFGGKWAIVVCGACVICCDRRSIARQFADRARDLLHEYEMENIHAGSIRGE